MGDVEGVWGSRTTGEIFLPFIVFLMIALMLGAGRDVGAEAWGSEAEREEGALFSDEPRGLA